MTPTADLAEKINTLASHKIFSCHPRERLAPLAGLCHWCNFRRGEMVFRQGEMPHHAHIVRSGRVKMYKTSGNGQVFTTLIAGPANTLNAAACFGSGPRSFSSKAMTDVHLLAIPARHYVGFVIQHPESAHSAIDVMASLHISIIHRIMDLIEAEVSQRILNTLTLLCERFGTSLSLTNADLAELTGTTRETTARVLSQLNEMGLLVKHRGRIEVLDPDQLKKMASGRQFII
jgi:CRP-like cAMP-binding protein